MKKLGMLNLIVLLGWVCCAQASALADLANREKARREALHREGKIAKTFTNADIVNLKSVLAMEVRDESGEIMEWIPPKEEAAPQQQSNEETEKLKQEREEFEQKAENAQQAINQGGGYYTRNIGNQYREKREAEQRMHEIDDKLNKAGNNESEGQEEQ